MDITQTWEWPQWSVAILLFASFLLTSARHGEPMVITVGDQKGQPMRHSGFIALGRIVIWLFILTCGGFFA